MWNKKRKKHPCCAPDGRVELLPVQNNILFVIEHRILKLLFLNTGCSRRLLCVALNLFQRCYHIEASHGCRVVVVKHVPCRSWCFGFKCRIIEGEVRSRSAQCATKCRHVKAKCRRVVDHHLIRCRRRCARVRTVACRTIRTLIGS